MDDDHLKQLHKSLRIPIQKGHQEPVKYHHVQETFSSYCDPHLRI